MPGDYTYLWSIQDGKCYYCKEPLSNSSYENHIHHINGNHKDNRRENRCLVHVGCHVEHHLKKRVIKEALEASAYTMELIRTGQLVDGVLKS